MFIYYSGPWGCSAIRRPAVHEMPDRWCFSENYSGSRPNWGSLSGKVMSQCPVIKRLRAAYGTPLVSLDFFSSKDWQSRLRKFRDIFSILHNFLEHLICVISNDFETLRPLAASVQYFLNSEYFTWFWVILKFSKVYVISKNFSKRILYWINIERKANHFAHLMSLLIFYYHYQKNNYTIHGQRAYPMNYIIIN